MLVSILTAALPKKCDHLDCLASDIGEIKKEIDIEWNICFDGPTSLSPDHSDNVIINENNLGAGPSRNIALASAKSPWVYPLDADDRVNIKEFIKAVNRLHAAPGQWMGTSRGIMKGEAVSDYLAFSTNHNQALRKEEIILAHQKDEPIPHPNSLFLKREYVQSIGGWPNLQYHEDLALALIAWNDSPGEWLKQQVTLYRSWDGNATKTKDFSYKRGGTFQRAYNILNNHRAARGLPAIREPRAQGADFEGDFFANAENSE